MAPNRRKSKAPSAADAAAARQKFKVGDLVLAKVKGFPAWPATISEPEKWGYKPDSKKVLVFFFGTDQIAFCSPLDVEAFTEEKKQALQGKRYGKSADFVRAVQEIIESYDELATQSDGGDLSRGIEVTTHPPTSVRRLVSPRDLTHNASEPLINTQNSSVWTKNELEASPPFEDAAYVKDDDQNSPNITSISETPLESSNVSRKRGSFTQRSRTSKINLQRPLDIESHSEDSSAGIGTVVPSALCSGSPRKANSGISHYLVESNLIHEDNPSGIASQDNSVNKAEGSSFDSTCMPDGTPRNLVELAKKHGLDIKAVFVKKKRKSNRKRFDADSLELTLSGDKVPDSLFGVHNYRLNSPNACEKSYESLSKVDGDEYLPLVKRARVRMGKLPDVECHADALMFDVEEKSTNGCNVDVSNGLPVSSINIHSSNEQDIGIVKKPSCSHVANADGTILANDTQLKISRDDFPCDKVDGDYGLPLSESLNPSTGVISVTAHENSQPCVGNQFASATLVFGSSTLVEDAATITRNNASYDPLGLDSSSAFKNDIEIDLSANAAVVNPPCIHESNAISIDTAEVNQDSRSLSLVENEIRNAVHVAPGVGCLPFKTEEQRDIIVDNQVPGDQSLQCNLKKRSDPISASVEPLDHSTEISKCMVRMNDDDKSQISLYTDLDMCRPDGNDSTGTLQLPLNEKIPAHIMSESDGELKLNLSLKSGSYVESAGAQNNSSHCSPISNVLSSKKVVLGMQTIPSSVSDLQHSPLTSSIHPVTSTRKGDNLQDSSFFCSADKQLVKKEECATDADVSTHGSLGSSEKVKHFVDAKASLTSFGNVLGTLTRTKDSIGRATRVAIECAKAGLATKVVDILSRTLENESNLNRKVDLFFLLDSMMQCSRGMKGEVGGMYPSAIQSALPRLLSGASGNGASENRRQCLKVLKLWLERRILPDSVIRHHMQNLESLSNASYSSGPFTRRSARTERAFHDPLREMEGMLVDEYGSNSSFQLSGFCMPPMRKDDLDGSDSDGESFEAVTPEHNSGTPEEAEFPTGERHRHILEDVDCEHEMEDVAPSEAEMNPSISTTKANDSSFCAPPLPNYLPPSSPPLPTSPPPHVHPLPYVPHQNHSMSAPPLHPPHSVHSLPPPHPMAAPTSNLLKLVSAHHLQSHHSVSTIPLSVAGCMHPVYHQVPAHPSVDMIGNGVDSIPYGMKIPSVNNLPSASPSTRLAYGDSVDHRASDHHNTQREVGAPKPLTSGSFDSYSGPQHAARPSNGHSVHPSNGGQPSNWPSYDSRGYNARAPPMGPSNNLTLGQGDHRGHHSWREGPPHFYSNNYLRGPGSDGRSCYDDHSWRKPGSQERYEDGRYYGPPFPGDKVGGPYPSHPYAGPSNEHNRRSQGWGCPPREINHRNSVPVRPSSEGPRYWRQ